MSIKLMINVLLHTPYTNELVHTLITHQSHSVDRM